MVMLIVSAVSFGIILSALQGSVSSSQSALTIMQSAKARAYANGCIEDALFAIHNNPTSVATTGSKVISSGTCSYVITPPQVIDPSVPSVWTILSTGVENDVTVKISTNAILNNSSLSVTNWNENTHGNTFTVVYAAGPNGSVDDTTEHTVNYGENGPTITATANTNYQFVAWSDGSVANPRTDISVSRNISVTANFAPKTVTLDYTADANGTIDNYAHQVINYSGDGVFVHASPINSSWRFDHWSPDNNITNPRQDTGVITNVSVQAVFVVAWTCGQPLAADGGGYDVNGNPQVGGGYYRTVSVGNQCWMKDNLNVGTRIDNTVVQAQNATVEKYCYNNSELNCNTYGGLYQWNEAMQYSTTEGSQGICPTGWHVPSDTDWTTLTNN